MRLKQAIIIRKDLKMRRGKEIVQGAHASIHCVELSSKVIVKDWFDHGMTKICFQVSSLEELDALEAKANEEGLICYKVQDMGLTEFDKPEYTALGIGPFYENDLAKITKSLKLY